MNLNKLSATSIVALLCVFATIQAEAEPLTASLTIDRAASLATNKVDLAVTGTFICGPLVVDNPNQDFAGIGIDVKEASGRSIAQGEGHLLLTSECDGTLKTYQVHVIAEALPFHGGQAYVTGSLFVQDCTPDFTCEEANSQTQGQIRIGGGQKQ